MAIYLRLASRRSFIRQPESAFELTHTNGTGRIAREEFEERMQDERRHAHRALTNFSVAESFSLFKLLDWESRRMLTVDDFATGCPELRGRARAIDFARGTAETCTSATEKEAEMRNASMDRG